jgi:hypothetical protein
MSGRLSDGRGRRSGQVSLEHLHLWLQVSCHFQIFAVVRPDPRASKSGLFFALNRKMFDGLENSTTRTNLVKPK